MPERKVAELDRAFIEEENDREENFTIKLRCISVSLLSFLAGLFILT